MPTFAGPFDARTESTKRLLAILWKSGAEITHVDEVKCTECELIRRQAVYEGDEAILSLHSRGFSQYQTDEVLRLARRAALENPKLHDFVLPKPERNRSTCDRKKASPC